MDPLIVRATAPFFNDFSTFPKNTKKHEIDDSFTLLKVFSSQNGSKMVPILNPVFAL